MNDSTLPFPTKPDTLDGERWLMASTLEMALERGAAPDCALRTAVITSIRRSVSRLHRDMSRPGRSLESLPPETLHVCQETLGRSLAREEVEFAFLVYRDGLSLEDQVMHSKILKAIIPSLALLEDTGVTRLWEVLDDSQHAR